MRQFLQNYDKIKQTLNVVHHQQQGKKVLRITYCRRAEQSTMMICIEDH